MKKFIFLVILLAIVGVPAFVYFSPIFEKNPPKIEIKTNGFTNLKKPIDIKITDDSGIKAYKIVAVAGNKHIELLNASGNNLGKEITLQVNLPKTISSNSVIIQVDAVDTSKWNFFAGNQAVKSETLQVDTTLPLTEVINNSYSIGKGGSAAAVVRVTDNNLKETYILVNNKYKFKLTPFVKKGYYVSLIAWPINEDSFSAELVAEDYAGNIVKEHIPYYWRNYRYLTANIKLSKRFIDTIGVRVLQKMGLPIPNDEVSIFKEINEKVRKMNEEKIREITSKIYESQINSFSIKRFKPLPGSAVRAYFGEYRKYFYNNELISQAIHEGIDLAKVKRSKIYANNYGKVVAEKYIGIYGNTLIIYHKLGLYTLYAHTSVFKVKEGDSIYPREVIARTGSTGAVFGDHLHFGVYIQGVAVNPKEWMDQRWIRLNIIDIINSAKRIINK